MVCKEIASLYDVKQTPVLFAVLYPTEIEFHFNKSMHNYAKYSVADLQQFTIESPYPIVNDKGTTYWLPTGNYKVVTTEQDYVVRIPYKTQ